MDPILSFLLCVAGLGLGVSGQSGTGICTWYGADGEIPPGSRTACPPNYEVFDRNAMKAARLPALPASIGCGSRVRITNPANGKSVVVTINDKGTAAGKHVDLTYAAFGQIANRDEGKITCRYQKL